jgi:diguanylate cyclase (GGDEF)-like protein
VEHRAARLTGLRGAALPTLEDVEQRRFHLWLVMVVVVAAFGVAIAAVAVWGELPIVAAGVVTPVVAGFCAYATDQERRLRRATKHLLSERVLVTALESRLEELSSLLDAGQAMNAVLELSEVLRRILDNAVDLLHGGDGSVLLHEEPGVLRAVCVRGNEAARDSVVQVGHGIAGRVAATREALLIEGGRRESAMSVPLVHRGSLLGVLNVNARPGQTFDEYDLRALSLFGEHAASSIANGRLHEAERAHAIALAHRASTDPLTALGNRERFTDELASALAGERLRPVGVVILDLDDFKNVNDSLGLAVGDELLRRVAERLTSSLRDGDVAARLGGDEFAVLLEHLPSGDEALRTAERMLLALSGPIELGDRTVTVRASLGIAVGQPGSTTTDELLRNAEVAMYTAKGQGKGCARLFEPVMHTALLERLELEAQLEVAVERAQLDLRYQPIVSLRTGRVSGFEALVRWNHPERGELPPDAFIPVAEETGAVVGIDRWVLLKACCQGRAWQRAYPADEPLIVGVNLSTRQLEEHNVVELVQLALEVSGLPPEHLVIEITESFLIRNEELGVQTLHALRDLGVRLAIDDFGTGYSSLSYLRHLPIDVLKIDRSFISGLDEGAHDEAIIQAVVALGRALDIDVIAEGVETESQAEALRAIGCLLAQGFLWSKPLSASDALSRASRR